MECSICIHLYNRTDRYAVKLNCLHLICSVCCFNLKQKNISKCPICLKPNQISDDLSKCETVENILLAVNVPKETNLSGKVKVILRNLRGNFSELTVNKSLQIRYLKQQIEDIEGVNPASQWLLHNGRALQDAETVESSGVVNGDFIYLVIRSFGG